MKYITTIDEKEYLVEILDDCHVTVNGITYEVDFQSLSGQPVYSALINQQSHEAYIYSEDGIWQVVLQGSRYSAQVEDEREKRLRAASGGNVTLSGDFQLKSPMPGLVVSVAVQEGSNVQKGDVLIILESMKMQNELRAPLAGVVSRLRVQPGESVERGQSLLFVGKGA